MTGILFAARTSWVSFLIVLLGGGFLLWLAVRVFVDAVEWFREEILPDWRRSKQGQSEQRSSRRCDSQ